MKHISWIASLLFMSISPVFAQRLYVPPANEQTSGFRSSYPTAGSRILDKDWKKIGPVLKEFSFIHSQTQSVRKVAAWNFIVGSTHDWWATDLSGSNQFEYKVPSTCRKVGTNCYIFVEDAQWNSRVNQEAVDSVQAAFDSRTPADPAKGIYQTDTDVFGSPPNFDGDPKIIILILDIKDGYSGSGGYVAGYFYGINEYSESDIQQALGSTRHSSEAEIYYVDCNPGSLSTPEGMTVAAATTAHEFQHMIHFKYDPSEVAFVNEGLSESAEKICGYGLRSPTLFYANTNVNFTEWDDNNPLPAYARAALFTWYMIEQFGVGIAKDIVQSGNVTGNPNGSPRHGIEGYNDALAKYSPLRFLDVLKNFAVAIALNDTAVDSKYGFKQLNLSSYPTPRHLHLNPNVPSITDTIEPYATQYVSFSGGDSLSFADSVYGPINISAIATGTAGGKVTNVPPNAQYTENDFGAGYSKVVFAITNQGTGRPRYKYTAHGAGGGSQNTEVAYDDGNPEGYYQWTTGDSVAVQFDAMPGMVLDSIRVAFRRSGSISYGIWRYSGTPVPTPLAQKYGSGTMVCTDSTPPYPYPVPYRNWLKTDVSAWNVDLNYPFIVGFAFSSNAAAPGLMMSKEPYTEPHHSFSYTDGSNGRQWYIIVTNDAQDSAARYLVRAYMHYGSIVINPPSAPPNLISPADGATDQLLTVDLHWNASLNTTQYHLQVSTSSSFTTFAVNDSTITTTTQHVGSLTPGTVYYWRVSARNSMGESQFSSSSHFTTIPAPSGTIAANTSFTFPKRTNASDYSPADYRIIGLPGASNLDISSLFSGTQNTDWQVYWDDGSNTSDSLLVYSQGAEFTLSPGRAFWVISKDTVTINQSIPSVTLNSGYQAEIALHSGWNLIANPFGGSITWSEIQAVNSISSAIYAFDSGSFAPSPVLEPYIGYYLFNGTPNATLTVLKVPYEALYAKTGTAPEIIGNGWQVNVKFISGTVTDRSMKFGISENAYQGLDILDSRKPRAVGMIPGVFFERKDWDARYPVFSSDIRRQINECEQWTMTVRSNPKERASFIFQGITSVPHDYEVYLIDHTQTKYTDLRSDSVYSFTPVMSRSEFSVVVGKKEAVLNTIKGLIPTEFSLGQNFPNPFNPTTNFSVQVPSNSFVTITVFNVLGQPVRSLYSGVLEAGRHWFSWDGRNESHGSLPSGVYYCRMEVPGIRSFSQKMILLK
jgi:hypothetical protein